MQEADLRNTARIAHDAPREATAITDHVEGRHSKEHNMQGLTFLGFHGMHAAALLAKVNNRVWSLRDVRDSCKQQQRYWHNF